MTMGKREDTGNWKKKH